MEWLKDPKNQPKVAAGLSVFIVLMLVAFYFLYLKKPSMDTTASAPPADAVPATVGEPAPPGAPGDAAPAGDAAATGDAAAAAPPPPMGSAKPMEAWRADPFTPIGYKPPKPGGVKPKPPILDFPFISLPARTKDREKPPAPELVQPVRRMAGVLVNDRVYAIIESGGESEIVQPGDTLKDRLAVVDRIERDKVVLRTKDEKPRYIVVRMAAAPRQATPDSMESISPTGIQPMDRYRPPMGTRDRPRSEMGPEADFN